MGRPSIMSNGSGNGNGHDHHGHDHLGHDHHGHEHGPGHEHRHGMNGNGGKSGPAWLQSGNSCDIPCSNDWCYPCGPPQCCTPYYCPPNRPTVYPPPIFIPYRVDWYQARLC